MRQGSPCRCSHPHTLPERKDWFTQLPSPMNLPIQPSTLDFQAIRSGCFGTLNLIYKIQYIELSIFYGSKISRWPDGCQPESVGKRCACHPHQCPGQTAYGRRRNGGKRTEFKRLRRTAPACDGVFNRQATPSVPMQAQGKR